MPYSGNYKYKSVDTVDIEIVPIFQIFSVSPAWARLHLDSSFEIPPGEVSPGIGACPMSASMIVAAIDTQLLSRVKL
jgi:hypothetical protein